MNKMTLLLFALAKGLKFTAWRSGDFRKKLQEMDMVLQIRTVSGSTARYYVFSGGEVFSKKGIHPRPGVALIWKDEAVGFKTMTNKDPKALFTAIQQGNLKIEGKAEQAMWFAAVVMMMVKGGKAPKA